MKQYFTSSNIDFYVKRAFGETEARKFIEPTFFSIQNNNDIYGFSIFYLNYRSKVVSFVIDNVKIDDSENSIDIGKLTDKLDNLNLFSSH
ncbi:hypothetical protein [Gilliamella sp. wkB178]|uniref:hypothetical protein n=1 Tax=Gilliamella sp. wkB178 TaxID=3120259 RepID=UPI0011462136|nr:hypothetical protein [Gilliamella apicola]